MPRIKYGKVKCLLSILGVTIKISCKIYISMQVLSSITIIIKQRLGLFNSVASNIPSADKLVFNITLTDTQMKLIIE